MVRSDSQEYFSGYAALFYDGTAGTEYKPLPNVRERIVRTAFDEVLRSKEPIEAWYNHSKDFVLGTTADNSLFLETDSKGLKFLIPYDNNDPDHQKVKAKIRKGVAKGASFNANGKAEMKRSEDGNGYIQWINKINKLTEVSIVNNPAYVTGPAIIRSQIDEVEKAIARMEQTRVILERLKNKK